MAHRDPADKAILRFEVRRYATRCESQERMIERADTLREIARLVHVPLPYNLGEVAEARDVQRHLQLCAEQRIKDIVADLVAHWAKADAQRGDKLRAQMADEFANLTGPLGHLRSWAQKQLLAAEQAKSSASGAG